MKWNEVKKASEIHLGNIHVEFDLVGTAIRRVTLSDQNGGRIAITARWDDITVLVPRPPEVKTIYRVHGSLSGVSIAPLDFDSQEEAKAKIEELAYEHSSCSFTISQEMRTVED